MTRDIQRRLQHLESQVPRQPTEKEKFAQLHNRFLTYTVAFYLGDPAPEESIANAYRRALGYSSSYDFVQALDAKDSDLKERIRQANRKLLAKFGVSWEEDEWDAIVAAYKRMEAGFSEFYRNTWSETCRGLSWRPW